MVRTTTLAVFLMGCSSAPWVPISGAPPEFLSEMNLVEHHEGEVVHHEDLLPYDLNTPLFSDYTEKERAVFLPEGETMRFDDYDVFDLPVGSAVLKTFLMPADLRDPSQGRQILETRLMIHSTSGWENWPYIWDEEGRDARLRRSGGTQRLSFTDRQGQDHTFTYLVPQRNQCQECHEIKDPDNRNVITLIGPRSRNLDLESHDQGQLEAIHSLGLLDTLPGPSERPRPAIDWYAFVQDGLEGRSYEEIEIAARDYLDVNCAHCHNPRGVNGISSQLFLNWDSTDEFRLGKCKRPGSAGHGSGGLTYDIVPGDHTQSILHYRMATTDPGAMMPQLGRTLAHTEAADLIAAWIDGMEPDDCQ